MKQNTTHRAGNFIVSIGRDGHQLAILSLHTGDFVELKRTKTNKFLRKIKTEFKLFLVSSQKFFFERMSSNQQLRVIEILKGK